MEQNKYVEEAIQRIQLAKEKNMDSLNISYLGLTDLPDDIYTLKKLKKLFAQGNRLTTISPQIEKLKELRYLALEHNKLTTLPKEIGKLLKLNSLFLGHNSIKQLPNEFGELVNLKSLELDDNPIESPPIEIVRRGVFSITNYLKELEGEKEYLYEAKLLIVGEGGAGKTSLNRKLLDPSYELVDSEKSTEGIKISQLFFNSVIENEQKKFRTNMWDFGGQEIYHTTHQFFLTKRSLYILLTDTRNEDTDFNYWLNVVELLSDNSPLIIVQNEKKDRKRQLNLRAMQGKFSNITTSIQSNLKTNRGLGEIKSEIKHQVSKLPHIGTVLPKTWVDIRNALEKIETDYISINQYLDICKENGIEQKQKALFLSEYFHDLGVFLHFQDESLLKKIVILNPSWGTDAVYKLLDNKYVLNNFGRFSYDELTEIWDEDKFNEMHDELLQLIEKFELIYRLEEKGFFIAPQLLKVNQPSFDWNYSRNTILRYSYDFLPKGIITRLIVSLNEYIENQELVWKEGIIITRNKTNALILQVYDKNEILIRIQGVSKKELLTIVTEKVEKIHRSYPRIRFEKLVQCICSDCQADEDPHFFTYKNLFNRWLRKVKYVECDRSYKKILVSSLIDDALPLDSQITVESLKEDISSGDTLGALGKLGVLFKGQNEIISKIASLKNIYKDNSLGILSKEDFRLEENKIRVSVLELIDDLKIQFKY